MNTPKLDARRARIAEQARRLAASLARPSGPPHQRPTAAALARRRQVDAQTATLAARLCADDPALSIINHVGGPNAVLRAAKTRSMPALGCGGAR